LSGWYDGATVFANSRNRKTPIKTPTLKEPLYSNVVAPADSVRLLTVDERVFQIPMRQKGFPGQNPAFYPDGVMPADWIEEINRYVSTGVVSDRPETKKALITRSLNPLQRAEVEAAAIKLVTRHYERLRYAVTSREPECLGWDLEAIQADTVLRIEVKGLSGSSLVVELTPNEYKAMTGRYRDCYRLGVVTDALSRHAKLRLFSYDANLEGWFTDESETLKIKKLVGARMTM
jgi:hypothetical protein